MEICSFTIEWEVKHAVVGLRATFVAEGSVLGSVWVLFSVDYEIQILSFLLHTLHNTMKSKHAIWSLCWRLVSPNPFLVAI